MRLRTLPLGTILTVVVLLVAATLWVVNCSGPRPTTSGLSVQPPPSANQPYQLSATVRNAGPGHGEVQVTFRLVDKRSGQTFEQMQTVALDAGESSVVSVQITAPPGDYTPQVEVSYPPGQ